MIESNTPTTSHDLLSKLSKIISRLHYLSQEDIEFILVEGLDFIRRDDFNEDIINDAFHYADDLDKLVSDIITNGFRFDAVAMASAVERIVRSNWEFRLMLRLNRTPVLVGGTPSRPQVVFLHGGYCIN
jgi:hypothetical protein